MVSGVLGDQRKAAGAELRARVAEMHAKLTEYQAIEDGTVDPFELSDEQKQAKRDLVRAIVETQADVERALCEKVTRTPTPPSITLSCMHLSAFVSRLPSA